MFPRNTDNIDRNVHCNISSQWNCEIANIVQLSDRGGGEKMYKTNI